MMQLGIIPTWQFSANPSDNPMLNPTVDVPSGMYQAGVYYTQPAWGQPQESLGCVGCASRPMGFAMIDEGPFKPIGVPYGLVSYKPLPPLKEMDAAARAKSGVNGLGFSATPMPTFRPIGVPYGLKSGRPLPPLNGLGYVMVDEGPLGAVTDWAWIHRKPIILSALGVIGGAAALLAATVLR